MVAGTKTIRLGLAWAIAARVACAVKRASRVTLAPSCRAGVVWILSPPTWNSGNTVKTWSAAVMSCMCWLITAFQSNASWRSTAPLGRPVVPEV
jgi:hypothetical protein